MGEVHARVPMVAADERRAVQLDAARDQCLLARGLRDMLADLVGDHEKTATHAHCKSSRRQGCRRHHVEVPKRRSSKATSSRIACS
jgi:hypothetical protein